MYMVLHLIDESSQNVMIFDHESVKRKGNVSGTSSTPDTPVTALEAVSASTL